ncbi:hypothetical protein [Thermococcus sp. PK]|jgi:hypothetical protein|uniref:hypothetical protein n=1 Tax=Thermococcus sp. PK TaxID=913025 RepID=UPI0005B2E044|nr:hypothetical protein [Thermococcus sp. PK]
MNKTMLVLTLITLSLLAYAVNTAELPPASFSYIDVFYTNNESVTYITSDGTALFGLKITPYVDNFNLEIIFPEGTSYLVRYGDENINGTDKFKITVKKDELPEEIYIQFQLPSELAKEVVLNKGSAKIEIKASKLPFWRTNETITARFRKRE